MKRWILFFSLFIIFILVSFVAYVSTNRADLLAASLSKALDNPVRIKAIHFTKNGVQLRGFRILNPRGSTLKNAINIDKISIKLEWTDLAKAITGISSDKIMIDSIKIDKPHVSIELFNLTGSDSNWKRIADKLGTPSQSAKQDPPSREFAIKKLTMTNIHLEVKHHALAGASLRPKPIPKIEFIDLGVHDPIDTRELVAAITMQLLIEAAKELDLNQLVPEDVLQEILTPSHIQKGSNFLKELLQPN